jgi:hypothetical protein
MRNWKNKRCREQFSPRLRAGGLASSNGTEKGVSNYFRLARAHVAIVEYFEGSLCTL